MKIEKVLKKAKLRKIFQWVWIFRK